MKSQCAVCGASVEAGTEPSIEPAEPPDFDTRPGEPLRSTIALWVSSCPACGYCASDLSVGNSKAGETIQSDAYRQVLSDAGVPLKARHFLAYAYLLDKLREHADAGWSALHAAWVCDDAGNTAAACQCREQAIEYWKRGKHAGQPFSDDFASEYALVADVHRRMGQFELALVTCSEALDMEDLPPVIEMILRRQKTLVEQKDMSAHSLRELLTTSVN